jgi:pimeloyl-ACP methyl ester carboxylesterase
MARRVAVGSLEVEYDEVGEGERPFVLVHGFSGSRDDCAPRRRRREVVLTN